MQARTTNKGWPKALHRTALLYGTLAIAFFCYFHLFLGHYIDDAFITLSYAATLARSGVWGMAPDLTSNAATSPLNVLLLAAIIKIVRDPVLAICVFNVLLALLIYSSLRYFSRAIFAGEAFALITTALLLTNPLLSSTQGLESYLLLALVLLACRLWDRQAYRLLGLVLGALFLTRPDALAVAFIFVLLLLFRRQWRTSLLVVGCMMLPVLPWLAYAWLHLGSLVPDTLLIKLGQASWEGTSFLQGPLLYWRKSPTATLLSLALAPGLLFLRRLRVATGPRASLLLGLGAYAVLHFVAYACMRVPPYHWYYAVEVAAVVVFGTLAILEASAGFRSTNLAILALVLLLSAGCVITSVRSKGMPAISTNWGTPDQYRDMAVWINQHVPDRRIRSDIELGTLQYYTDADLIDTFSDRSPIVQLLGKPHSRPVDALLRFNFRHLQMQDLSHIRYSLSACRPHIAAEMEWTTYTPAVGSHTWCLYRSQ